MLIPLLGNNFPASQISQLSHQLNMCNVQKQFSLSKYFLLMIEKGGALYFTGTSFEFFTHIGLSLPY